MSSRTVTSRSASARRATNRAPSRLVRAAAVAVVCSVASSWCVAGAPRVAAAQTTNDEEVLVLVDSVFEAEYAKKQYVDALEKLQLASNVCQEGSCSAKVRAKVLVAVATVLSGGLDQPNEAKEVFKAAIKEDPNVDLLKGYDSGKIKAAWDAAKGNAPKPGVSTGHERKKYSGSGRPVRGWKSPEAYFYYQEAKKSEEAREWVDCAGYASDSIAAEPRISTQYLRASCNERGGKWVDALNDYQACADQGPKAGLRDIGKSSQGKVDELTGKMPKLVMRPPPKIDDLKVEVDDVEIANDKLGGELWMDPGQHRVKASGKSGGEAVSLEQDVDLSEGKTETIDLKLVPAEARVDDTAIMQCLRKAKTKDELAKCIGDSGDKTPLNVTMGTEVSGYHDTDHVDVLSPAFTLSVESPTQGWSVNGSFLVDVVTAASTDIVATASPRWIDHRYVPALGATKKFGETTLGLNASTSVESDYIATGVGASISADVMQKRLTPSFSYDFGYDISGRAGTAFSTYSRKILRNGFNAGLSIVMDKSTVLSLGGTFVQENGDSSKPYRYIPTFRPQDVPLIQPGLTILAVNEVRSPEKMLEQLPLNRQRYALAARIAHRFTDVTFRAEERLYIDSWGTKATTTDMTLPIDAGDRFRIWPHLRGHFQTGADFWKLAYAATPTPQGIQLPALRTGDRELGPLIGLTGGGGMRLALGEQKNVALTLAADVVYTRFLDTLFILQRIGFFSALGAEVDFE